MSEVGQKSNEKAAKIWRVGALRILEKMRTRLLGKTEGKKKNEKRNCVCGVLCVRCGRSFFISVLSFSYVLRNLRLTVFVFGRYPASFV
jgi:hypothetical protein